MERPNRIRQIREERGLSLKQLGEMIGKSYTTVQRYESGLIPSISDDVALDLAKALDVSPQYLLGWSDVNAVTVSSVPLVEEIIKGEFISNRSIEVVLKNLIDKDLTYYIQEDSSMFPLIPEGSLILAKDKTEAKNGSLVVVLENGSTKPVVRRLKFVGEQGLFISNDPNDKILSNDDAVVIGDVISVTTYYSDFA